MINQDYPLIVDSDGTLINSDLLIESFFKLIKTNPIYIFIATYCIHCLNKELNLFINFSL